MNIRIFSFELAGARPTRFLAAVAGLLCLSALLGGCQSTAGGGAAVADARAQAASYAAAGEHANAARALESVIGNSTGELRDALLLEAAREWIFAANPARAVALANQRSGPLTDVTDPATRLIAASQALGQRQGALALQWLEGIARPYPQSLTGLILEQTARARFSLGDAVSGVAALSERELWLSSNEEILANHQLLWQLLTAGDAGAASASGDPVVDGWLALAQLAEGLERSPGRLRGDLIEWRTRFPGHPANAQVVPTLIARYRSATRFPQRVALLLPLTGNFAASAEAIRDGFISAVIEASGDAASVQVSVYDTTVAGAAEAYSQALGEGAELVVGPLRKDQVLAVAGLPRRVPTLSLNDPGADLLLPPGSDFFRFSLAPEDEARQAALRATQEDGHANLIALIPNSGWGERVLASVKGALAPPPSEAPAPASPATVDTPGDLRFEDGRTPAPALPAPGSPTLIDYGYYANSAVDFSAPIRRVLRLDSSEQRYDGLRRILGERVEFEPRRRADVDALFVAASSSKARLIRPQLRFHYAADLPLYMTSAALDPDPASNPELDGVYFADIPWLASDAHAEDLRWQALEQYAADGVRRARLYAFGVDAFGLVPAIWSGVIGNEVLLEGLTGHLRADADGRVARELAILQLRDERLELVAAPGRGAMLNDRGLRQRRLPTYGAQGTR